MLELCALHAAFEGLPFRDDGQIARWEEAMIGVSPSLFAWVVDAGDGTAIDGYMTATIDFSTWSARGFAYLDCLFLRSHVRGRGLGRALITELSAFARARGISEIQWQTVPTNAPGIKFYQAIGATSLPKIRFRLVGGEDAIV